MTTQREVAEAFFLFENSPSRASNFELVVADDGMRAWLVSAGTYVLAYREPLCQIVVNTHSTGTYYLHESPIQTSAIRRQARNVKKWILNSSSYIQSFQDEYNRQYEYERKDDEIWTVEDFEQLDSIYSG